MSRIILRWLNFPALILLVACGVAVQTSIFSSYPLMYLQPDVVLLAVLWCALRRDFVEGGILTLILAEIAEIHSACPRGIFLAAYMAIYLAVRGASRLMVIPTLASMATLTIFASVGWKLGVFGILKALGSGTSQWRHTLSLLAPSAVIEGAAAVWVYRWLERFDWATYKSARAQQALDDELQMVGEGL